MIVHISHPVDATVQELGVRSGRKTKHDYVPLLLRTDDVSTKPCPPWTKVKHLRRFLRVEARFDCSNGMQTLVCAIVTHVCIFEVQNAHVCTFRMAGLGQ